MMDENVLIFLGVTGVLGLIVTFLQRRKRAQAPSTLNTDVQHKAEANALKKAQKAQEEHDKAVTDAVSEAEKKNSDLVDTQKLKKQELTDDPDALNQHLKDVGKSIRGDG